MFSSCCYIFNVGFCYIVLSNLNYWTRYWLVLPKWGQLFSSVNFWINEICIFILFEISNQMWPAQCDLKAFCLLDNHESFFLELQKAFPCLVFDLMPMVNGWLDVFDWAQAISQIHWPENGVFSYNFPFHCSLLRSVICRWACIISHFIPV